MAVDDLPFVPVTTTLPGPPRTASQSPVGVVARCAVAANAATSARRVGTPGLRSTTSAAAGVEVSTSTS